MKREITCARCASSWRQIARNPSPEALANNEVVTVVEGKAIRSYQCDGCNRPLPRGEVCFAVGLTAGAQVAPPNWESEFIEVRA